MALTKFQRDQRRKQALVAQLGLAIGDVFSTNFESGCTVLSLPDDMGDFQGRDSDGVEVSYNIVMVCPR